MSRSCALPLALSLFSLLAGCYSSDDGDDGSSPGGASGSTSGGRGGGGNGSGGSASGAGGSAQGGTASGGTSAGGTSTGGTSSGGTSQGGSSASCVTETIVLGESQTMSADCGSALPEGVDDGMVNVFYGSSVGSGVKVCRRASSQGCDPHGWWSNGGDILLCDQTCSAFFDNPGMVLYIEVGCESDTCL